jgi:hypothetical protein
VQSAPGFPCALCMRRRVRYTQNSDAPRRENADGYRLLFNRFETNNCARPEPYQF